MPADIFLRINGLDFDGGSHDATHKGAIEVLSLSWETDQQGTPGSGGGSGTAKASGVKVTKLVDNSSTALHNACASGRTFDSAILTRRKEGQHPVEFFRIKMSDVVIASIMPGRSTDDGFPTEEVGLEFGDYKSI